MTIFCTGAVGLAGSEINVVRRSSVNRGVPQTHAFSRTTCITTDFADSKTCSENSCVFANSNSTKQFSSGGALECAIKRTFFVGLYNEFLTLLRFYFSEQYCCKQRFSLKLNIEILIISGITSVFVVY